jgi:hypothetical protein
MGDILFLVVWVVFPIIICFVLRLLVRLVRAFEEIALSSGKATRTLEVLADELRKRP